MKLTPEGRKPVDHYNADELQGFLVADAVKHHATFLPWFVAACERIAKLRAIDVDAAYNAVLDEVEALTGLRRLPVVSPASLAEMRRLGLL